MPPSLESLLKKLFENNNTPDVNELANFLQSVLRDHSATSVNSTHFILVDGLDECSDVDRDTMVEVFADLARCPNLNVKIFLSSLENVDYRYDFGSQHQFRISMGCPHASEDLKAAIDLLLTERCQRRQLVVPDDLYSDILEAMVHGSDGM